MREACAKQQRLLQEIDFLESQQKKIIDAELRNIEELKKKELSSLCLDFVVNVISEQVAILSTDQS